MVPLSASDRLHLAVGIARRAIDVPGAFRLFAQSHKRAPALSPPRSVQDKILWRKLFDWNPLFVTFNDKLAAKAYARARLPDLKIPETLWVGMCPADIPGPLLRERVMIKTNHGCGFNIFHDGDPSRRARIEADVTRWLARPYNASSGEWAYSEIPRRVFVEEWVVGPGDDPPAMINVHVMGGRPVYVGVYLGQKTGQRWLSFFDPEGERLPFRMINNGTFPVPLDWAPPPAFFDAVRAAEVLGQGVDYVRCDFLATESEIWFSELTTYVANALGRFDDQAFVDRLHAPWDLRESWFLSTPQEGWRGTYRDALLRVLDAAYTPSNSTVDR